MSIQFPLVFAFLSLLVLSLPTPALAADIVGKVVAIQGNAMVYRGDKQLPLGDAVRVVEGDELVTSGDGKVRFELRDGTRITLANKTKFKIDKYRFNREKQTSDVRFSLATGAFRAITGAIGQQANPKLEVKTRVATMGIRGTDFWGGFIFSDALDVTMVSGKGVYIKNEYGQVELTTGGQGTTVKANEAPTAPKTWPDKKVNKAVAATALEMDQ
ncbi:FecR family protein [Oceanospirillum beijerinckii]|uniref:FecR family protein n=1 Tax=Oceanospirillum beijerinckii TaxID=64976 RepID=UPI000405894A|nr:FecR domain-containing protein [Oceanospirillum beijerinckii]MAC47947.1 hypothetical protein [Oceanospirillum sp.]